MLTPKKQGEANIAAIAALQLLDAGGDDSEGSPLIAALKPFNGWGSLWQIFQDHPNGWEHDCHQRLKELLTPDEYERARASILNAHYTDPAIIQAVWEVLTRLGFTRGKVLEPSCGSGWFMSHCPHLFGIEWTGVELDPIPARIAQYLHPQAAIYNQGFEQTVIPDGYFDLAIGNVPFGSYRLHEPRYNHLSVPIHCHFLAKMADLVRPGGLIALITSTGTLDSAGNSVFREWLSRRATLLLALRLPNNTFKQSAHTQVTTDLLIFQRLPEPEASWVDLTSAQVLQKNLAGLSVNKYYAQLPKHILGIPSVSTLYGGRDDLAVEPDGRDIPASIVETATVLDRCYKPGPDNNLKLIPPELQPIRPGEFCEYVARLYQRDGQTLTLIDDPSHQRRIRDMISLASVLEDLIRIQGTATDGELAHQQSQLNEHYDGFKRQWGYINSQQNEEILGLDPRYAGLQSLETPDLKKADIFTKRTTRVYEIPDTFSSPEEALLHCLNVNGRVDIQWMEKRMR